MAFTVTPSLWNRPEFTRRTNPNSKFVEPPQCVSSLRCTASAILSLTLSRGCSAVDKICEQLAFTVQYSYMDETYPVCGLDECGAERKLEKRNKKIEAKK